MDADGYVQITGRLKEMIIRGGENIYPREIEDLLYTHPDIAEVAVFGVPDEFYGEQIMAWVQLHENSRVSESELRDFLKPSIAHFKIPKYICFVDKFPDDGYRKAAEIPHAGNGAQDSQLATISIMCCVDQLMPSYKRADR